MPIWQAFLRILTNRNGLTMGTTALVIGATGLVGRSLVRQLSSQDQIKQTVTLTRRPAEPLQPGETNHIVDFANLDTVSSLFKADLLFSCLGTTRGQAGSIQAQRVVDLDYQYEAARLAAEQGVRHYLLVSSSGANASSRSAYLKMKGELEEKILALPFERISIFQPSLLVGERPKFRLGEKIGSAVLPVLTALPGLKRYRPIQGEEVAARMIQVCQNPGKSREWFILDEVFPIQKPIKTNDVR